MAPSCSLGPTALGALSGQSQFLPVPSHLSASEIISLVSWERKGPVIKSLWQTKLSLETEGENNNNKTTNNKIRLLDNKVISAPRTERERGTLKRLLFSLRQHQVF